MRVESRRRRGECQSVSALIFLPDRVSFGLFGTAALAIEPGTAMMTACGDARDLGCLPARSRRPHAHLALRALLLLALAASALSAWAGDAGAPQLQRWYQELRDISQRSPFGVPLHMQSEERNDQVSAEVHAILEHPFDTVKTALGSPASWCEIAPLNVTVKACTYQAQGQESLLTLYIGRKFYQRPQEAASQPYQFMVQVGEGGTLSVVLSAFKGLFGTTANRFRLEAAGVQGRTVIAMHTSYIQGAAAKLATAVYLATLGRDKVGFSREEAGPGRPAGYVKGLRGMVERNIMRYYLAIEAFLDTQSVPAPHRFEALLNRTYELMERYPLQLHDLEKAEYLDAKRREREDQLRLQKLLGSSPPP